MERRVQAALRHRLSLLESRARMGAQVSNNRLSDDEIISRCQVSLVGARRVSWPLRIADYRGFALDKDRFDREMAAFVDKNHGGKS